MKLRIALIAGLALIIFACGSDASDETAAQLELADSSLGSIVADDEGNTLYLFIPDAQGDSTCYDQCEANWPPLTESVGAGDGIDGGSIGSTTRTDGTVQVTYNGWPLYYFANDAAAGDTNGQGLNDVWFVLGADGEPIR